MAVHHQHRVAEGAVDVATRGSGTHRHLDRDLVPPGVGHVAESGAGLDADAHEVARGRVGGCTAEHRAAQVFAGEVGVVQEPAAREHHAAPGADERCPSARVHLDPDDPPFVAGLVAYEMHHLVVEQYAGASTTCLVEDAVGQQLATGGIDPATPTRGQRRLDDAAHRCSVLREVRVVVGVGDALELHRS